MAFKLEKLQEELKEVKELLSAAANDMERGIVNSEIEDIEAKIKAAEEKKDESEPAPAKKKAEKKKSPSKKKPAPKPKETVMVKTKSGEKNIKDISASECLEAYYARRDKARKAGKKRKSKSLFTRLSESLSSAAETAIKAVPKADVKENPAAATQRVFLCHKKTTTRRWSLGLLLAWRPCGHEQL